MGSVTVWARIEPHSRAADMERALEMRVHDPLWMLARQWQFGEFQGEDTGSPVWASVEGETSPLELYLPGPLQGHQRDDVKRYSTDQPLQFLVQEERQSAQDAMTANRRLAVEAGQHFLTLLGRSLAANSRAMLLQSCAVQPLAESDRAAMDADSIAFLSFAEGRALDGVRLLTALQNAPADAATALGFQQGDVPDAERAIRSWLEWCASMVGELSPTSATRPAWNPHRQEYSCALAAPSNPRGGQTVLVAEEYAGGPLDWFSFDVKNGAKLARAVSTRPHALRGATLPTGLSFRGMPANRLWEMEDAQVRFGAIEAGPTDLARLLLVEFLVEYGNDFFTMPLDIDSGVLARIDTLTVTNTFGDVVAAAPFANEEWRLFALTDDGAGAATGSTLFLPPVLGGQPLIGAPLEQLDLVRDEMANLSWAIEHIVQSKSGTTVNRHETWQAQRQHDLGDRQPREGTLTYRIDTLESTLPDFWIPLLPERSAPGETVVRVACYDPQQHARGRLLSEKDGAPWLYLFDEEIPRSGARITRLYQYARWYDGRMFSWIGRQKKPGRGSASSGLRHDVLSAHLAVPR